MQDYWHVMVLSFLGFVVLAAILLVPVWKFLSKEEEAGERFNESVRDSGADSSAYSDERAGSSPE